MDEQLFIPLKVIVVPARPNQPARIDVVGTQENQRKSAFTSREAAEEFITKKINLGETWVLAISDKFYKAEKRLIAV